MITKNQADRSINQLLCLILGKQKADASAHFAYDPSERVEFCFELVEIDMNIAEKEDDRTRQAACRRQFTSLESLEKLAQLSKEVKW